MATRYFCDKCDREFGTPEALQKLTVPGETLNSQYELCIRCLERLREWLKPDPKVAAAR